MARTLLFAFSLAVLISCERQTQPTGSGGTNSQSAVATAQVSKTTIPGMVKVAAGSFTMGDAGEIDAPPHEVMLSGFYIDKYLVTQEQYEKLMSANPSRWKGARNPVEQIRWSDAVRFCNARSQAEGLQSCYDLTTWKCNFDADGYRLPTEAEWEFACRAGTKSPWFFGNDDLTAGEYAWFGKNAGGHPHAVGEKRANQLGLYDICGNVWEWCNDFYGVDYYRTGPHDNPRGPDQGKTRVLRGGAWRFSGKNLRSGYRYNENPGYSDVCFGYDIYGFRCVRKSS